MCRNIHPLYNFDPPATHEEIHEASLQFVRKISGFTKPSTANELAFEKAVKETSDIISRLMNSLVTDAPHKNREIEHQKAPERALKRFGT